MLGVTRSDAVRRGARELATLLGQGHALYWVVGGFSLFANLLMMTGPLYMLQVYDRVLNAGSVETLVALSALVLFLYTVIGVLDGVRARIMSRVAMRFETLASPRVFDAGLRHCIQSPASTARPGLEEIVTIRRFIASPFVMALFDLPWTPIFFMVIFMFHPALGGLAVGGALLLVLMTVTNQALSRRGQEHAVRDGAAAEALARQLQNEAETVRALGMQSTGFDRVHQLLLSARHHQLQADDASSTFAAMSRMLRMLLQSAMLGLGAFLVLLDQMTAGGMIAGSILMGRALSPVESLLAGWPMAQHARQSWQALAQMLGQTSPERDRLALPAPAAHLAVENLSVVPPDARRPTLHSLTFALGPGDALGVIGPSAAGKTTLARALAGVWPAANGAVRLDGTSLEAYGADALGRHIGYLGQRIQLFDGTIAQNIARLAQSAPSERIVAAARMASVHELILSLPQGYETRLRGEAPCLSGGQLQRIGLARALYGDPAVLVLDEPNSNLDHVGTAALNTTIRDLRARGKVVIVMAHRPAAIQECNLLLVLENGRQVAFGPRDEVMKTRIRNAASVSAAPLCAAGLR